VNIMTLVGQNVSVILSREQLVRDCSARVLSFCYLCNLDMIISDERNSKPADYEGF
jgi:hypothetical protein